MELQVWPDTNVNRKQWALRFELKRKAPRSGPRRAPGGSVPRSSAEVVCYMTFDDSFRTTDHVIAEDEHERGE